MNTIEIINMCKKTYKSYNGNRTQLMEDPLILDTIMRLYNTTEIDWEEVQFLWVNYLEKGNLYISEAMEMARERIEYEELKATERELSVWLTRGI